MQDDKEMTLTYKNGKTQSKWEVVLSDGWQDAGYVVAERYKIMVYDRNS